jgi:glycyl-tRNA synthetase beta chain
VDRELLLELGCEELPAAWLPSLIHDLGETLQRQLHDLRLAATAPIETYATPRRLAARIAKLAERQTDLDETVTGPPVSSAFDASGAPTPAAHGFARKHGIEVESLDRIDTPRGSYLAYHKRARGRAAVDVLPYVLAGTLRGLSFPKQMHWDACLEDGKGELLFGRPVRWIVFLYGGRVVPFAISRSALAQGPQVQEIRSGAVTYGHRFLATSGRAGRALKVRSFDDYRARLAEHFVVLDRGERQDRITRDLDLHARRLGGRISPAAGPKGGLIDEVPDLVEYPSVIAGTFAVDFLDLPEEVLTTTMMHHQHFFPVVNESGRLLPAFLAVINTEPDDGRSIARNAERVLAARLRDARFFWEADRRVPLADRLERLETLLFHQQLGSYRTKAARLERLAGWIAAEALGCPALESATREAARLAKADLATDMVRELTELQGTMGGIYARAEGADEEVWKAIYYQYQPLGVERDLPPSRDLLGPAAVTWAAVSLADKLDTITGLFLAGEQPTGTRDPFGLRRLAQGTVKVLADLPELAGLDVTLSMGSLVERAREQYQEAGPPSRSGPDAAAASVRPPSPEVGSSPGYPAEARPAGERRLAGQGFSPAVREALASFLCDRVRYLFERRGFRYDEINAVVPPTLPLARLIPLDARLRLEALRAIRRSADFEALAVLFKRVKNIARELPAEHLPEEGADLSAALSGEPAECELVAELERREPAIREAVRARDYLRALQEASAFRPAVDRYFADVFVMVEDPPLRTARLRLMVRLRDLILDVADISEIIPQTES